ncbi:LIM domain-containing protein 2 isoform X2 [Prionailurus viverrinus]|uniref:LIM domain-containing protein 2 isoform X2 n=1 Tax=Prionailurus viverrinus TaxID=61388 RepID=UPI001FF1F82F|nr:LIM domain-containing protein 2 isoform X2 [Prionailurus viverrinus]
MGSREKALGSGGGPLDLSCRLALGEPAAQGDRTQGQPGLAASRGWTACQQPRPPSSGGRMGAAPGGGRTPRPAGAWEPGPGRPRGVCQTSAPTEIRAGPRANRGKLRHLKAQGHSGYPFSPQGRRRERHLSRDPRRLNLNSSAPGGVRYPPAPVPASVGSGPTDGAAGKARGPRGWCECRERGVGAGGRQRQGTASEGKTKRRGGRRRRGGPGGGSGRGGANGRARGGGRRGRCRDKAVAAAAARGPLAAAAARARALLAPEAPPGDRPPPRSPGRGPGSQRQRWQQHCPALQVLQPSGPGEGELCRLPEDRVPYGAPGGGQAHFPQLLLLLQALSHQAEPGQLRGTARGILLQAPLSAAV